jgi:beta-mannosidase
MRLMVLPDKPKRYELPAATITIEPIARRPGAFGFSSDRPAFFVKPEAPEFDGAFEDASFLLLPGEKRPVAFRSYDGRMPEVKDLTVMHLVATYAAPPLPYGRGGAFLGSAQL